MHDPEDDFEEDPALTEIINAAEKETMEVLKDHPMNGSMGFCYVIWDTQKQILKDKYGIDWESPMDRKPMLYD